MEEVAPLVRRSIKATHHPHAALAQHLFSVIVAHCHMMCCTAFRVKQKIILCAQDTEQIHGNHVGVRSAVWFARPPWGASG